MPKRQLKGIVVSAKMQKTVVVEVTRIKEHPQYKKRYKVHKRYKAHNPAQEYKVGDSVIIEECRPLSKEKRWKVMEKSKIKNLARGSLRSRSEASEARQRRQKSK